jgi:hypothetical protein
LRNLITNSTAPLDKANRLPDLKEMEIAAKRCKAKALKTRGWG